MRSKFTWALPIGIMFFWPTHARGGDVEVSTVNSPSGFCHQVAHDMRDDGMWWERSPLYHHFVLMALTPFAEAMTHCGVDLYGLQLPNVPREDEAHLTAASSRPKSLRLMFEAPLYLTFPDLSYPALGDMGDIEPGPLQRFHWIRLVGFHRYRDAAVGWQTRRSEPLTATSPPSWHWLVYDLPDDSVAATWPLGDGSFANTGQYRNGCSLFPSTGVAVLREAEGDVFARPESTAISLSYGPHGGGHGHSDKLAIVLFAHGRQWLPDFLNMPYDSSWKEQWANHTVSHNTLVVDELSQELAGTANRQWAADRVKPVTGQLEEFDPANRLIKASCDSAYPGLRLARQTWLVDHLVVDELDVRPSQTGDAVDHQFDYVLRVDGRYAGSTSELAAKSGPLGKRCAYPPIAR